MSKSKQLVIKQQGLAASRSKSIQKVLDDGGDFIDVLISTLRALATSVISALF
jgi:hypothetical protein